MAHTLVIVESAANSGTIQQSPETGYVVPAAKASVVKQLRDAARSASSVLLASDLDREGEPSPGIWWRRSA